MMIMQCCKLDEHDDFQYDDYAMLHESIKKTHQQYYQVSAFGGLPVSAAVSLQEENGTFKMTPNFGASIQWPYIPIGALDVSPGLRIMNFSYEASHQGKVQALQLGAGANFDFKPVLYFLPSAVHISFDLAFNYNIAYDLDQNLINYPNVETETQIGTPTYNGLGMNMGASIDYWIESLPIAFKLFGQGNIVLKRLLSPTHLQCLIMLAFQWCWYSRDTITIILNKDRFLL